ncbi:MAG: XRE family transcriptional regulator [Bryobacteraceae bacterium]
MCTRLLESFDQLRHSNHLSVHIQHRAIETLEDAESYREFHRLLEGMPLQKLRSARNLTQQNLARILNVNQSEISKIENRTDVHVSTLASYVEAMGGKLEIRAIFPDGGAVKISQFEELEKTAS